MSLKRAEAAHGGPFAFRHDGKVVALPDPEHMDLEEIAFRVHTGVVPEAPLMPLWKLSALHEAWLAHYDLPGPRQMQRLCYLVEHYYDDLCYDFRTVFSGTDFGQMWRERRWTELLRLIDRLPPNTWYSDAVSRDPDHVKALARAVAERQEAGDEDAAPRRPSWVGWSPEMTALTLLRDEVRHLTATLIAVNNNGKMPKVEPSPMPMSPLEAALKQSRFEQAKKKHQALVARMLPHKAKPQD